MTKFTIVTYIKNGKIESKAFSRDEATGAVELFEKVRSEGYEAYLFHRPVATKHCKSKDAREATKAATHLDSEDKPSIIEKIAAKVGRKPRSESQPQKADIGASEGKSDAVDLP